MTDTVNVPREAGEVLYNAFWSRNGGVFVAWKDQADAIVSMWRKIASDAALLAAAPKAEPDWNYEGAMADLQSAITVLIRRINGEADLASAAEWVRLNYPSRASEIVAHPEAPKVEQEPYGWVIDRSGSIFPTQAIAEERICKWRRGSGPIALYTHPDPASDARVISYEAAHADAVEMGYPSLTEALEDLERLQKDRAAFDGLGEDAPASDELLEAAVRVAGWLEYTFYDEWTPDSLHLALIDLGNFRAAIAKHKGPQS